MYNANSEEQKILEFWDKDKTFEKSVNANPPKADQPRAGKPYVFYDGPPFATGLPHYGHIVASLMKDVVPRFWTMRGFRVERRWGWDCHGLPIENIIEKDLHLATKRDIEAYGVGKFNEACRSAVLKYAEEWKKTVRRMGRWVDMSAKGGSASGGEQSNYATGMYKTMDIEYMESVWWVFKQLWERGLIYKDHKAMHLCPRCVTTLSNFEVTQNYKDVKDLSATVKFKIKDGFQSKFDFLHVKGPVYILAWTTTPWTLPGNVLLALGHDIEYLLVTIEGEEGNFILARERAETVLKEKQWKEVGRFKGSELAGLEYEPLFPYFADTPNAFRTVLAEFVTTTDGTGIVHIAPAYGEDDFNLGKAEEVPLVQHVNMEGKFIAAVSDFAGLGVKPKDDPSKTDIEIIKWLSRSGKLFSKQKIEHSYPHCWRCDTPLLNYATTSWFVRVTELKEQLIKNNQIIHWVPEHIKDGRFGKWLEGARDWAISRSRYWGTPLPVWEGDNGEVLCFGSIAELEKASGKKITDLHKHLVDLVEIKKDGVTYRRIPEVLDCWFESGSMPYGEMHYPFENKEKFEAAFPAEFIAEGQDQTRGWFYTLHILATALSGGKKPAITSCKKSVPAFKNVIVNGIVLAEDGKKMSKRLQNYPEPGIVLEKYGADAMRYYLVSSPVMEAESLNFSEAGVREIFSKVVNTLWNVLEFYQLFAPVIARSETTKQSPKIKTGSEKQGDRHASLAMTSHVLDRWALSKLNLLVKEVTDNLEAYRLADASRPILDFITELSQWYVRRSRDRFKSSSAEASEDKAQALATLREVLITLAKIMAPFTPFIAEKVFQEVTGEKTSVHLEEWPKAGKIDTKIITEMEEVRKVVELGLALRAEAGIKVRQVLGAVVISTKFSQDIQQIMADELNVKQIVIQSETKNLPITWKVKEVSGIKVGLNTELTPELKKEGLAREIIRTINQLRKDQGLTISDKVVVHYQTDDALLGNVFRDFAVEIQSSILAAKLENIADSSLAEVIIDGKAVRLQVAKL